LENPGVYVDGSTLAEIALVAPDSRRTLAVSEICCEKPGATESPARTVSGEHGGRSIEPPKLRQKAKTGRTSSGNEWLSALVPALAESGVAVTVEIDSSQVGIR
jgi:hypothetical protein